MTDPKPAKVTPTEEQRQWASGCVDAYRVSGTIEDVIAEGLVTRDRDVRRRALEEAAKWLEAYGTHWMPASFRADFLDKYPDHAD